MRLDCCAKLDPLVFFWFDEWLDPFCNLLCIPYLSVFLHWTGRFAVFAAVGGVVADLLATVFVVSKKM